MNGYLSGLFEEGPTPQTTGRRARSSDRRALSAADVADLLDIKREPRGGYDPLYWEDALLVVRHVGKLEGERTIAWRIGRDLKMLKRHGWTPRGECPFWEQLRLDCASGDYPWLTPAKAARLRQTADWLEVTAKRRPLLHYLEG